MQDMRDLYKAYAAVHDTTIKEELDNSKDQITEMNLGQMTKGDLVEVAEEIIEGLFQYGLGLDEAYDVVGAILEEASDNIIGGRKEKIVRIAESFEEAFDTVTDKAERNCEEAFLSYRRKKPLTEKWNNKVSHETGNAKIHASIIHEDREGVKLGLIEMISEKLDKVGEEDADIDNDGDVDSSDKYLKKRRTAIGKAMKKEEVEITEGSRKPGESAEDYVSRVKGKDYMDKIKKKYSGGKSKTYDPMKDPDFDHDKAERTRGSMQELYKGKHGQSEKEYQDGRSDGGKMVSGDSKGSGSNYSSRSSRGTGPNPAGGSKKPEGQGRMTSGAREDLKYRKANMFSKEELEAIEAKVQSWEEGYQRNPEKGEAEARKSETSGQRAERNVRDRLKTMDPAKAEAMKKQMRAVGLDV